MDPITILMLGIILALVPVGLIHRAYYTKPESAWSYGWFNVAVWSMWAGAVVCALILAWMGLAHVWVKAVDAF